MANTSKPLTTIILKLFITLESYPHMVSLFHKEVANLLFQIRPLYFGAY